MPETVLTFDTTPTEDYTPTFVTTTDVDYVTTVPDAYAALASWDLTPARWDGRVEAGWVLVVAVFAFVAGVLFRGMA